MTTEELTARLLNSSHQDLQAISSEELKELREFLNLKSNEISWILKGRAHAKRFANSPQHT